MEGELLTAAGAQELDLPHRKPWQPSRCLKHAGFELVREHIVTEKLVTPIDFETRLSSAKGAAFGLEPVLLHGIDPAAEANVSSIEHNLLQGKLSDLEPGARGMVIGTPMNAPGMPHRKPHRNTDSSTRNGDTDTAVPAMIGSR